MIGIFVEPGFDEPFPVFFGQAVEKLLVSRFKASCWHREGLESSGRVRRLLRSTGTAFRVLRLRESARELSLEKDRGEIGIGLPFGFPT